MARRRVLLLMKPFDVYPPRPKAKDSSSFLHRTVNAHILNHLDDRCRVHNEGIKFCQDVLRRKNLDWEPLFRNNISQPIRGVDLVVTVGGDGTLLQASHLIDNSIPVLGVNSDPTQPEEVGQLCDEFDATRSTGYLCAATMRNFEQILEEVLEGKNKPFELARISTKLNDKILPTFALNDILISHPCPATVSRFSFRIKCNDQKGSSLVHCRSSGLRICTAAGSTAAMLSAGGFPMPISSNELQFMVREPISPRAVDVPLMHSVLKSDQYMHISWSGKDGTIYIDGSHAFFPIRHGDTVEISVNAPFLKVHLPYCLPR
ncbi:probable NADH kinase isoform X2 [Phalaenopsis equestris]|uniref:probable NADH kinase isoform X2 n=1 Tax=Phalaenopsis equestris TaxID=78828 RepID=UPI0009E5A95A|nr:probable NADH kinase isoform X2 [Phalaenopsis equestris]